MAPPLPPPEELDLDPDAQRVDQLAREVLGDSYVHFRLDAISMEEDVLEGNVKLTCQLTRSGSDETVALEGQGVGLVDAFMDGVVQRFAEEYPSLKTIKVADFSLGAGFDIACTTVERRATKRSDPLRLPRYAVTDLDGDEFARWLQGILDGRPSP